MEKRIEYIEQEIKVLDIKMEQLIQNLVELGAKKIYDDFRTIMVLDTEDKTFLNEKDKLIRVTVEGNVKVAMYTHQSDPEKKEVMKLKTNNLRETMDFFHELGLDPITRVSAQRISYEIGKITFDIDFFPLIPPFLQIDIRNLQEEGYTLEELLKKLGLENHQVVVMGPESIHQLYHVNYFDAYQVNHKENVK